MKPRLLDLFSGAGGCSVGYSLAGFDVVGVDLKPMPRYPFKFHQGDALAFLEAHGREFDAIHASPPCQKFCSLTKGLHKDSDHPDLVAPVRELLIASGKPYVIENVVGAPLINPIVLCGTMFGLGVKEAGAELRRHRLFESNRFLFSRECQHNTTPQVIGVYGGGGAHYGRPARRPRTVGVWGGSGGFSQRDGVQQFSTVERAEAMGIDWMTGKELSQAIPPAYTEFIGRQLIDLLPTPSSTSHAAP